MIGDNFINVKPMGILMYTSIEVARIDWEANVDFLIQGSSTHICKRDHLKHAWNKRITLYMGFGQYETLAEPQVSNQPT